MGHFYNPPQPFIGGRQPDANHLGVISAPPTTTNPIGFRLSMQMILAAWNIPPVLRNYELSSLTTGVQVDNPPVGGWVLTPVAIPQWALFPLRA